MLNRPPYTFNYSNPHHLLGKVSSQGSINDGAIDNQAISHQEYKQNLLDEFSLQLSDHPESACLDYLKRGLTGDYSIGLYRSRYEEYWECKMPESACLAMAGLALKVFGDRVLDAERKLDSQKLEMAMQMLFGKDGSRIQSSMLSNIQISEQAGQITLTSRNYHIDVEVDEPISKSKLELINSANINQCFFHQKTLAEVKGFFGSEDEIPNIVLECTGKDFQQRPELTPHLITEMTQAMKANCEMYANTVNIEIDGYAVSYTLNCTFFVDSKPALSKKCSAGELSKEVEELARNAYVAMFNSKIDEETVSDSYMFLSASQSTEVEAKKVVQGILDSSAGMSSQQNEYLNSTFSSSEDSFDTRHTSLDKKYHQSFSEDGDDEVTVAPGACLDERSRIVNTVIIDLRLLTTINKAVVALNERPQFEEHTQAMEKACTDLTEEGQYGKVGYFPIHCEVHSHLDVAFAKTASPLLAVAGGGAAIATAVILASPLLPLAAIPLAAGIAGTAATVSVYQKSTFSNNESIRQLHGQIHALYREMSQTAQQKYRSVLNKWDQLLGSLHMERSAIPFATLTQILADAITKKLGNTQVQLLMGCSWAKDRTTSVLAGINLFRPLIERELEHPQKGRAPDIERFFDEEGYFNCDALSGREMMLLKDLYDIRLLHAANKFNAKVDGNVSTDILRDTFFRNLNFVHESNPHTIMVGC